jgi:predicted DNA-binding protein (MmcQ/YjbR family)
MNKKHWNTIAFDGSVSDELIIELTDLSYDLVRKSLPKKMRDELDELH